MPSSTKLANLRILVSGAGIAGNCLAYWLSRAGLDSHITLMERSPKPRVTGQAIDIRGPAIEVIKKMHMEEAIRSCHTTEEGTRILGQSGQVIAEFPIDKGNTFTAEYEILRADLCRLFMKENEKRENVEIVYGDHVESLKQYESGIDVTLASGSTKTFDVVVGADGAASKTRSMILDEKIRKDSYKPIGQYIAFFSIPRQSSDTNHWYWYNTPKRLGLMTRPHRSENTMGAYLTITTSARGVQDSAVEAALKQGPDAQKRILHEYFKDAGWQAKRILAGLDQADDFYMSRAAQVKLPQWHAGRSVVIGDAAFATFGIGTTLAIVSAYMLAGEISKTQRTQDIPETLKRYEDVFRPIYKQSGDLPSGFPQLAFPETYWGLGVRNALISIVSKTKLHKLLPGDDGLNSVKVPDYQWTKV